MQTLRLDSQLHFNPNFKQHCTANVADFKLIALAFSLNSILLNSNFEVWFEKL